jgi:hypothetical protein
MQKGEIEENYKQAGVSIQEDETIETEEKKEQPRISELEDSQGKYILDFAKANYKRIISPSGREIKINGTFYKITKIDEDVEDKFIELEDALNKANPLKPKEKRKALYEFLTFACATDRGELTIVALILGMMQKGFRHLQ